VARSEQAFINGLVTEEIRRMVADAVKHGAMISADECAAQILRTYRGCGLRKGEITNRVMMAAASAGVAVEFGRSAQAVSQAQA
jgi:hypothetical protein